MRKNQRLMVGLTYTIRALLFQRFHLFDGAAEHAAIEIKTNRINESALLVAQDIAGPPNFKVLQSDFKPGAQFREPFNRLKPLLGIQCYDPIPRNNKISIVNTTRTTCIMISPSEPQNLKRLKTMI